MYHSAIINNNKQTKYCFIIVNEECNIDNILNQWKQKVSPITEGDSLKIKLLMCLALRKVDL